MGGETEAGRGGLAADTVRRWLPAGVVFLFCASAARAELTNYMAGVLAGIHGVYDSPAAESAGGPPAVCLIDLKHPDAVRAALKAPAGQGHLGYLGRMRARLAELSGLRCVVVHYTQLKADDLPRTPFRALLVNALDKGISPDYREQLLRILRETTLPTFGFCGGHQLIAEAFGGGIDYLRPLRAGEADPHPAYQPGRFKEWGFMPVDVVRRDPLFEGLSDRPVVREMHAWHVTNLPPVFVVLASTADCPVQAIRHRERLLYGTQFHPEQYDDAHRDGRTILQNFFRLASLPPAPPGP